MSIRFVEGPNQKIVVARFQRAYQRQSQPQGRMKVGQSPPSWLEEHSPGLRPPSPKGRGDGRDHLGNDAFMGLGAPKDHLDSFRQGSKPEDCGGTFPTCLSTPISAASRFGTLKTCRHKLARKMLSPVACSENPLPPEFLLPPGERDHLGNDACISFGHRDRESSDACSTNSLRSLFAPSAPIRVPSEADHLACSHAFFRIVKERSGSAVPQLGSIHHISGIVPF